MSIALVEVESYGTLEVRDKKYILLSPFPVSKDDWMPDEMMVFHVVKEKGVIATQIEIYKEPFIIDRTEQKKIKIKANKQKGE